MAGEKILIVEDNSVNQKLLLMVLRPHGYQLLTATDGEQAIKIAGQETPDLILMDLQLPKMNGFAAARMLKEQMQTARIPIVALTAHAMPEQQRHAGQVGFDDYITKPINTRTFPALVRDILDRASR